MESTKRPAPKEPGRQGEAFRPAGAEVDGTLAASSNPSPIVHIGIVVPDLDVAKQQLGAALGLAWSAVRHASYGDWELQAVASYEGPPYLELQQGSPGSPWDARGTARLDHLQRWTPDRSSDVSELIRHGVSLELDGDDVGQPFCYLRTADGIRIELIEDAMQPKFLSIMQIEPQTAPEEI